MFSRKWGDCYLFIRQKELLNWHKIFILFTMEKKETGLQEQEAPRKNHDDAFVQVGKNGEPVIPENAEKDKSQSGEKDRVTTLEKR